MKSHNSQRLGKAAGLPLVLLSVAAITIGAGVFVGMTGAPRATAAVRGGPASFAELVAMPEGDLAGMDIGLMNLLCAEGLPGAENLDIKRCLAVLDQWAEVVSQAERKYLQQFHRDPARYDHSLAKFKAVNLALTLKQDLGCDYNKDLITSGVMSDLRGTRFFRDSSDLFLHGFTRERKGSCASLPVLMVAVGRRCGYPLHLVACKGHLFCRWDDGRERFNIETAVEGVDSKPDEHYRSWPHPCTDEEMRTEKYLKSLSPAEELGVFAQIRAACLEENQRLDEAARAYEAALRSFPESRYVRTYWKNLKGEN